MRNVTGMRRFNRLNDRQKARIICVITKAERATRGDSYATEAEERMILQDPFAFLDMNLTTTSGEQLLRLPVELLKAIAEER